MLSEDELAQRYPSGEGIVRNRVRWSIHYLRRANLLTKPARGLYVITERGKDFLEKYKSIDGVRVPGARRHNNRKDTGPRQVNTALIETISNLGS